MRVALSVVLVTTALALVPVTTAAAPAPIRIMPLGDSITEASTGVNHTPSYRRDLWDLLDAAGHPVDLVGSRFGVYDLSNPPGEADPGGEWDKDHEGHWGWSADQILNGRPSEYPGTLSDWAPANPADLVIMHLGTNGMNRGHTPESTIEELEDIIEVLRAANPNIVVFVAQIIPSRDPTVNAAIDALNALIPSLASLGTSESPVVIVDLNTDYDVEWNFDDLHPGPVGRAFIAQGWFDALEASGHLIPDNSPPVVDAGPDMDVNVFAATVSGSASDDGFPQSARRTYHDMDGQRRRDRARSCVAGDGDYVHERRHLHNDADGLRR